MVWTNNDSRVDAQALPDTGDNLPVSERFFNDLPRGLYVDQKQSSPDASLRELDCTDGNTAKYSGYELPGLSIVGLGGGQQPTTDSIGEQNKPSGKTDVERNAAVSDGDGGMPDIASSWRTETTQSELEEAMHSKNPEKFYSTAFRYANEHPKDPFVTLDGQPYALIYNSSNGSLFVVPYNRISEGMPAKDGGTQYMLGMPGTGSANHSQYFIFAPGADGKISGRQQPVVTNGSPTYPGFFITVYEDGRLPKGTAGSVPANF